MIPYFLKEDGLKVLFNLHGKELIFFIPRIFLDRNYYQKFEGKIGILGIFNYTIRDIKTGKDEGLFTFNYPTKFWTIPSDTTNIAQLEYDGLPVDDYTLFRYRTGDVVIESSEVVEDIANTELFYTIYTTGKLPSTIDYDKIHEYFLDNIKYNGSSYGVNIQLFGMIIGETAISKNNNKFRYTEMEDMNNYNIQNIKMLPKTVSAYSAYTSEVYDESIVNASLINKSTSSPLEKMFMGH